MFSKQLHKATNTGMSKKSMKEKISERFNQRQREAIDRKEQRELERNKDYQPEHPDNN